MGKLNRKAFKRIADKDFATIAQWDKQLHALIHAHYLVNVGRAAVEWLAQWWNGYAGEAVHVNVNCSNCIAEFLERVGKAYFQEKELRAAEAEAAAAAAAAKAAEEAAAAAPGPAEGEKAQQQAKKQQAQQQKKKKGGLGLW